MSDSSSSGDGVLLTPSLFSTSSMSDFSRPHDHTSPHHGKKVKGTGRHSYKQSPREKEAVWPDFLETALLEALTIYRPTSSKAPQKLLRFPKRNAFISNYIFKVTGKRRTPKQVGSRLQQLRETCTSEDILTLIQSKEFPDLPPKVSQFKQDAPAPDLQKKRPPPLGSNSSMSTLSPDSSTLYSSSPCTSPTSSGFPDHDQGSSSNSTITQSVCPRHLVHVDLKPYEVDLPSNWMHQPWTGVQPATFTLDLDESRLSDSPMNWQRRITVLAPRPVWAFVPTIVFSASMLSPNSEYETFFAVHDVNGNAFYKEVTKIERVSTVSGDMPMLYRTSLIPNYWATLASKASDLRQYTIVQDIMKVGVPVDHVNRPQCSIVYKFDCSPLSPIQISPDSLPSYYSSYPQDPPQLQPDYYLYSQPNLSIPSAVFDNTEFSAAQMLPMNDFPTWIDYSTANCYAHSMYTPTTNLNESDISASLPFRDFFPY